MSDDKQWRDEAFPAEIKELKDVLPGLIVLAARDQPKQSELLAALTDCVSSCIATWAADQKGGEHLLELFADELAKQTVRKLIKAKYRKKGKR